MSKDTKATEQVAEPTVADLMKIIADMQAKMAGAVPASVDFTKEQAAAEKAGFKAQVVPSLQKGASPALRVDY